MKKRTPAIILSAAIALAALGGCGGNGASSSNIKNPGTNPPSTGTNIPPVSGVIPATPTPRPEDGRGDAIEFENGVTADIYRDSFENGPSFSIYITEGYVGGMEDSVAYVRSLDNPEEAYIEIKFIAGGKADRLAPSVLDGYDTISDLVDNDTVELSNGIAYRFVEGRGSQSNWKAYLLDGAESGAIQIVVREGTGAVDADELNAIVKTFAPG